MSPFDAILFDKDGTLFDFNATWGAWAKGFLLAEVDNDQDRLQALAAALGYDLASETFATDSMVIAHTADEIADAALPFLSDQDKAALVARMNARAARAPQVEVTPLAPYFRDLRARGLRLGLMTNDAEAPARAHLRAAGIESAFDFIAGSDSGYGAKPDPAPLRAFCEQMGVHPARCVMVGDSLHDLGAGRAAGMQTAGVLTGLASAEDLAPLADIVMPSIAALPAWLDKRGQP